MSAVSALVLVMLAALIHGCCGIRCYVCKSKSEPTCDDPFNRNSTGVHTLSCKTNACVKAKVTAKGEQTLTVLVTTAHSFHTTKSGASLPTKQTKGRVYLLKNNS